MSEVDRRESNRVSKSLLSLICSDLAYFSFSLMSVSMGSLVAQSERRSEISGNIVSNT